MLRLCSKITITTKAKDVYTLDFVKNVVATSSWDTMVDTSTVTLPKKVYVRKDNTFKLISLAERTIAANDPTGRAEKSSQPLFQVGDKIKIEIGYDFNFNTILEGLITNISPTVPVILQCADPMWLLGRVKFDSDDDIKSPLLSVLLKKLQAQFISNSEVIALSNSNFPELPDIEFMKDDSAIDFPLVNFSIKNKTIAKILEELKSQYYIYPYYDITKNSLTGDIISRKIICGNYYKKNTSENTLTRAKFHFQNNVIAEELIDIKEENVKVKIIATNIAAKGAQINDTKASVGSNEIGAKEIYIKYHNLGSEKIPELLEDIATRRLKTMRYDGYSGHFDTFGKPFVKHGDTIQLVDDYITERNGLYKVRQVDYSFGDDGFKQKIHLHYKDEESTII